MKHMSPVEAAEFAARWLPAWTGNRPGLLASFYTDDVYYLDPSVPQGIVGKTDFVRYLSKLLADNPDWVWTHEKGLPLQDGFLNHWQVVVPVGDRLITCRGVCTVQLRQGLIYRNEVYFDTSELIAAIRHCNARKRVGPLI